MTTRSAVGTRALELTGNALSQRITGNAGDNLIHDGGAGAPDVLRGLGGNDIYRVFNTGDQIIEKFGEGLDRVISTVDFVLTRGSEVELITTNGASGKSAIDLTGNEAAQSILGNAGDNILGDGGAGGIDTLRGFGGNDTYVVSNAGAIIVEVAGDGTADRVSARVDFALAADDDIELMKTTSAGATTAIDLTGNAIAQTIYGNAGSNVLDGKGGADVLKGLGGKDFFQFSSTLGGGNIDRIADFSVADDTIRLDDAIFTAFAGRTSILPGHFRVNTTGLAQDASDHIIYRSTDGALFYDADGIGGAAGARFATLTTGLALTNADFVVA
jgi:Ca2+-binding RTX toxin-like protein